MFGKGFKIFRLFGIDVRLDVSFFLIVPLFTWILGAQLGDISQLIGIDLTQTAWLQGIRPYIVAFFIVLALYVSVVIHEFGHALTARLYDVQTRNITLWFLGGVANFTRMPRQPGAEAIVAIAGPITSFIVAALFGLGYYLVSRGAEADIGDVTLVALGYLAMLNIVLAIFNCLPALPLDGGRVLRSLLALGMPYVRATQISAVISKVLAGGLVLLGLFSANFFLVFIAVFVWMAVNAETRQAIVEDMLRGVRARDVMNPNVESITPDTPAGDVLTRMMQGRRTGFPVCNGNGCEGIVDLQQLHGVDPRTPVRELMKPDVPTVSPDAPARRVFDIMGRQNFNRVIVVDAQGHMQGIVTKTDLIRTIQIRSASGLPASMQAPDDDDRA